MSTVEAPPPSSDLLSILLVEDHEDSAEALACLLDLLGYRVTVAGSVAAALAAAERGGIDLVLSDLTLPDGHGHDLMRLLVDRHGLRGIALSGHQLRNAEDLERARQSGFALHLTKPVGMETLTAAIRKIAGGVTDH
jgi:CheY-like chemotaxis protein